MRCIILLLLACPIIAKAQPWLQPLIITHSADGKNFDPPAIFQDSSGVPSAVLWKGDTLVCAFQWFRLPLNSPTWDRVAVKFSYDRGNTWTSPTPIGISGLPANYQRPFDPTLAVLPDGKIRIYFSSSKGLPNQNNQQIIDTYSAVGSDGVQYTFEPGARYDHPAKRVIDPAVAFFQGHWHYTAPVGAPQEGAFHQVSDDGILFTPLPPIPSDPMHNWTGNLMLMSAEEMRFYGSGPKIFYSSTADGQLWGPYISTNVQAGDPTVLRLAANDFLMIAVGMPGFTPSTTPGSPSLKLMYNQGTSVLNIAGERNESLDLFVWDVQGRCVFHQKGLTGENVDLSGLPSGFYAAQVVLNKGTAIGLKFVR